ncbi:hypothetical protein HWV62_40655 [Athelia sp. TMB]|nr:hypothetical protein HWV62_2858 [Athelia sp. TMB]KAF7979877.1 hypothetical protein HWV62_40655 [Athelia sp. TMB]
MSLPLRQIYARTLARRSPRALPKSGLQPTSSRRYSIAHPVRGSIASYVVAGLCGGFIVVAGGYTWYHFSGVKQAVDATRGMTTYLAKSKESLSTAGKASSNAALAYLRGAAKSYAAIVPGAGAVVDAAFNSVDEVFDAHQEEASAITQRAYEELQRVIGPGAGAADDKLETAYRVTGILKAYLFELHALGAKAGGTALAPVWERYPGAREKIDGAFGEMKRVAEASGPGAKKVLMDTQQQRFLLITDLCDKVKSILSDNLSSEALAKAGSLIRERTWKLRKDVESKDSDGPDKTAP